jgi:hypothetical protein
LLISAIKSVVVVGVVREIKEVDDDDDDDKERTTPPAQKHTVTKVKHEHVIKTHCFLISCGMCPLCIFYVYTPYNFLFALVVYFSI